MGKIAIKQKTMEEWKAEHEEQRKAGIKKMRLLLTSGTVTHTRFRPFDCVPGGGYVTAYIRDETSPSGVISAGGVNAADFEMLEKELKISCSLSPLSPTEMLSGK